MPHLRPRRSVLDPPGKVRHLLRREAFLGRHLEVLVGLGDGLDQEAVLGMSGHDGRTAVAPHNESIAIVNPQSSLGIRAGGMAGVTVADQHWTDLLLEKVHRLGVEVRAGLTRHRQGHCGKQPEGECSDKSFQLVSPHTRGEWKPAAFKALLGGTA